MGYSRKGLFKGKSTADAAAHVQVGKNQISESADINAGILTADSEIKGNILFGIFGKGFCIKEGLHGICCVLLEGIPGFNRKNFLDCIKLLRCDIRRFCIADRGGTYGSQLLNRNTHILSGISCWDVQVLCKKQGQQSGNQKDHAQRKDCFSELTEKKNQNNSK